MKMDWDQARGRERVRSTRQVRSERALAARNFPASEAQLRYLRKLGRLMGEPVPAGLTRGQASALIERWSTWLPTLRRRVAQ